MKYEIEKWDETGTSSVWVKVPQIDASSSTDYIYIYYGNSSAVDGQDRGNVWDSDFKMVQHLNDTISKPESHNISIVPITIKGDSTRLFIGSQNGGGLKIINKNDFSTTSTLKSGESIERLFVSGNYLAFNAASSKGYLYNLSTSQYIATVTGTVAFRAVYIDNDRAYFGEQDTGKIFYVNLSTLEQGSFTPATDDIREISGYDNNLIVASNDSRIYLINKTTLETLYTFTDTTSNAEVAQIDANYIWFASDFQKVWIKEKTSPYTNIAILHGPTSDVTSVDYDGNYWFVSSDDGKVYVFEAPTYNLISIIYSGGSSGAEQLWLDKENDKLYFVRGYNYSGSHETNVYVYDYSTQPSRYEKRTDSSSNSTDLISSETTTTITGQIGTANEFDGSAGYIEQKKYFNSGTSGSYISQVDGQAFFYPPLTNLNAYLGNGSINNYFLSYYDGSYLEGGFAGISGSSETLTSKISNNDFESGFTSGLANSWGKEYAAGHTYSDETVQIHGGSHAQKITATVNTQHLGINQAVSLTRGKVYKYSAWVYTSSGDSLNFFIGGKYFPIKPLPATWTQISGYVVNSQSTSTPIRIYVPSTNVSIDEYLIVDDVTVSEVSDIPVNQGFKIYSTKTGSTNNLTIKNSSLDPNSVDLFSLFSSNLQIKNRLTLEAWVYPDDDAGDEYIAGNWTNDLGYLLYRSDKKFIAKINGTSIETSASDKDSANWYYVVLVADGTNEKIYVNGDLYVSESNGASLPDMAGPFVIGASSISHASFFDGKIDEVRVSDTNRSADWIKAQYTNMTSGFSNVSTSETYDGTPPASFDLISITGYTKDNTRPSLSFRKSSDTNGISSYSVNLDSGKNKSYSTSGIPSSGNGSASYIWKDDNDLKIEFLNENDSDSSNDEIRVYFKGLNSSELTEGKHTWSVTAYDPASNSTNKSADFYIDKTSPSISDLAIANVSTVLSGVSYNLDITNRMPSFSGLATVSYQGSTTTNSNGTKDTFDKVSSGPQTITLTFKKQSGRYPVN